MQWAEKYKSFKQKNNLKNISFVFLNIFLILLALNLISRNFFITQKEIMLLATVYVLIGFLLLNIPFTKLFKFIINKRSKKNDFVKAIGGLFFIFLSFVFLLFTDSQMIWVASIPLMISGLDLLLKSLKIQKKELYVLSFASFIYAIFYIVVYTVPFVWNALQKFSIIVSNVFGASFGPTVSGFWIFIIFVIFSKTIFFNTKNKKRALLINLHLVLLLVFWITYMAIISIIGFETKSNALNHHFYFFIACLILTFWFVNKIELFQGKIKAKKQKKLLKKVTIWAAVLLLISVILLTTFTGYNVQQNSTKNILFYGSLNNTIGRFDTPDYDKYGDGASGMFGMFPIYLSEAGYNCKILVNDEDYFLNLTFPPLSDKNLTRYSNFTDYVEIIENNRLTSEIFEDIDVFVVADINVSFTKMENEAIWNFVEKGGGLLAIGDHTNVGEIMDPLNDLLKPTDIRFRFDSAIPIDNNFNWEPCYQLFYHPSTFDILGMNQIKVSVGGSLDIGYNDYPTIIGRNGLSDEGNKNNSDLAYLGDYEYNKGEQIGDIILAACTYYGDGRVYVFGDTSMFQGFSVSHSYPLFMGVVDWLYEGYSNFPATAFGSILLIFSITIYLILDRDKDLFVIIALSVCIALIISFCFNLMVTNEDLTQGKFVCLDASHIERFNLKHLQEDSLTGLMINMMRNDYLPQIIMDFSKQRIQGSEIVIFNAPTKSFNSDEVEFLKKYIYDGGLVILATGFDDKEASMPLLNEFSLDIYEIPLGPVPYVEEDPESYQNDTRFVNSWPIFVGDEDSTTIIYEVEILGDDYILMTFSKYGKGGFLLISDSEFLHDKNIEDDKNLWPGNLIKIKTILEKMKSEGVL